MYLRYKVSTCNCQQSCSDVSTWCARTTRLCSCRDVIGRLHRLLSCCAASHICFHWHKVSCVKVALTVTRPCFGIAAHVHAIWKSGYYLLAAPGKLVRRGPQLQQHIGCNCPYTYNNAVFMFGSASLAHPEDAAAASHIWFHWHKDELLKAITT